MLVNSALAFAYLSPQYPGSEGRRCSETGAKQWRNYPAQQLSSLPCGPSYSVCRGLLQGTKEIWPCLESNGGSLSDSQAAPSSSFTHFPPLIIIY